MVLLRTIYQAKVIYNCSQTFCYKQNEHHFRKYEQASCSKHRERDTWKGQCTPNIPREITNTAATPHRSVWALRNLQQSNESSWTAFPGVFHSRQWNKFRWKLQDQDVFESQAGSRAGRAAY